MDSYSAVRVMFDKCCPKCSCTVVDSPDSAALYCSQWVVCDWTEQRDTILQTLIKGMCNPNNHADQTQKDL